MAKIFLKTDATPDEKTLILAVREAYYQSFLATNWTDLRVGFFLSICGNADPGEDDTITGLTETIGSGQYDFLPINDRFRLGVTDSHTGQTFLGYTNLHQGHVTGSTVGSSNVVSSDGALGTTNTNFWRVKNGVTDAATLKIWDGDLIRAHGVDGSQLHLPQDTAGAGGYATLVAMRFTRPDAHNRAKLITMTVKSTGGSHSGDILYSNTPNQTVLEENLQSFPATVQQLGPIELSQAPDTFFVYWPFHNSRLRIHAYGLLRTA